MQEKRRFYTLDLIRGLAVFLMLLAHAVYFFHNRDSSFLISLEKAGNAYCFIAFILVSGAASYIAYLKDDQTLESKNRIVKKILITLVFYYLIAMFVESKSIIMAFGFDRAKIILDIVLFRLLPSYTEYIPPFIVYPLILIFFDRFFTKVSKKLISVFALSVGLFLLGYLIYLMPVPELLAPWKAFLAGSDGYYRFPILQYYPIYLIGLYLGRKLLHLEGLKTKKRLLLNITLISGIATLALFLVLRNLSIESSVIFRRWPPTPVFLLGGLSLVSLSGFVFYQLKNLNRLPLVRDFFLSLGQNAFSFLWVHILLLSLYQMIGGTQVSDMVPFFIIFIVFMTLAFILAAILPINLKFSLNFHQHSYEEEEQFLEKSTVLRFDEELMTDISKEKRSFFNFFFPSNDGTNQRKRLIKKRHLFFGLVLGFIATIMIYPIALDEAKSIISNKKTVYWLSDDFAYRQKITIKNKSSLSNIGNNNTVEVVIDHRKLVDDKKVKNDGDDITIVYFTGTNYEKVDYKLQNEWNQSNTTLALQIKTIIKGGKESGAYYLYFGNFLAKEAQSSNLAVTPPSGGYAVTLGESEAQAVGLSISKRWNLIQKEDIDNKIHIVAKSRLKLTDPKATYQIINTTKSGSLTLNEGVFEANIDLTSLSPGSYQIQVIVSDGDKEYKSQKEAFFVSYPLYVAWTQDWEGRDVEATYLKAMTDISDNYNIPMTHFFNPRIYVTQSISPQRSQYLTDWLKDRLSHGDGFGLHLHAFNDLVIASGVTPKTEPRWDDSADGYSVLLSAYSKDEIKQIIAKSLSLMDAHGLPHPEVFRAGGWYANLEVLTALEEMNFKADSSGRTPYTATTPYPFGKYKVEGFWNLKSTTSPYKPSRTNQNITSLSDPINLLEIPDNGADSYGFSSAEMIVRFHDNFKKEALSDKAQITFLTHPHWFGDKEQAKIKDLFKVLSTYRYDDDNGPLIFTSSEKIYNAWMDK